jgi:nucleoside-diphosphate-sugar epimerase
MQVLLTGATGYIGSAVAEALQAAGHEVAGIARSDAAAATLESRGIRIVRGDITQPETVAAPAREADAFIHTAMYGVPEAGAIDRALVSAVLDALAGSNKPCVYTSGIWVYGKTGPGFAYEDMSLAPPAVVAWRPAVENLVVDAAKNRGVRGVVVRPGMVYGRNGGLVQEFIRTAREHGAARVIGDGNNRWTFVHIDDLADLYVRLLKADPGTIVAATAGNGVKVRRVAEAASRAAGAGGRVQYVPLDEARQTLGAYADALALDQNITSSRAQSKLGWRPRRTGVLDELAGMH